MSAALERREEAVTRLALASQTQAPAAAEWIDAVAAFVEAGGTISQLRVMTFALKSGGLR